MRRGYEPCLNENESCKYYPRCYADKSHQFWPKGEYRTRLEKQFAGHFMELQCRQDHDQYHQLPPPDKPSAAVMLELLQQNPERGWLNGNPA